MRLEDTGPGRLINGLQEEIQAFLGPETAQPIWPFNNGEAWAANIIGQPGPFNILFSCQAITVHMEEGEATRILMHQGKGGAGDILVCWDLQALGDELGQGGLAHAQVAVEEDNIPLLRDSS